MEKHQHGGNIYEYGTVVDFSASINPLGMPESVRLAAVRGVNEASHYPEPDSRRLIRSILAMEAENGMPASDIQIICGNGAAELIFLMCAVLRPRGALLLAPSFAEYELALRACKSRIRHIYLLEEEGFRVTERVVCELQNCIADQNHTDTPVEMLFLCQPNNPTGELISEAMIRRILDICKREHIWLVLDACFVELLDEAEAAQQRRLLAECMEYERTLILKAFTKSYAMAGLRLGYLMGRGGEAMDAMERALQPWNISLPAQYAGLAALKEREFLKESRHYISEEKYRLLDGLYKALQQGPIRSVYGHAANYIFFKADTGLKEKLLAQGILIRDCANYCGLEGGYYRIAVRTGEENVQLLEALRRI